MIVFSGFRTAWSFAGSPTRIPSLVKATTDGNIFPPYALPSALGMIFGVPPSMYAASEFVVPRSIPMILAICLTSLVDDDLRGDLLEARLPESLQEVVPDHPDALACGAFQPRGRGVELVEDRQETRQEGLVAELQDRLRVSLGPLAVVLELRLEVLEPREQLLVLPAQLRDLVAARRRRGGLDRGPAFALHGGSLFRHPTRPSARAPGARAGAGGSHRARRSGTSP